MSPASGLASAYLLRTPLEGILNGKKRRSADRGRTSEGRRREEVRAPRGPLVAVCSRVPEITLLPARAVSNTVET